MDVLFILVAAAVGLVIGFLVGRRGRPAGPVGAHEVEGESPLRSVQQAEAEEPGEEEPGAEAAEGPAPGAEAGEGQVTVERLESENARLVTELEETRSHLRRYRYWAEDRVRESYEELAAVWDRLRLKTRVHELPKRKLAKAALTELADIATRLQRSMEQLETGAAEMHFQLGLWQYLEENLEQAVEEFQEAATKGHGFEAWLALGDCHWSLERPGKAQQAYRRCMGQKDMPNHVPYRVAKYAVERRKYRECLRALEPILAARDNPIEVFMWAGLAYGKLLQSERAVEICAQGLKKFRNSPELLANMIIPLQRIGRLEDAEEIYLKAAEIDSGYSGAPFAIGVAYMHAGDHEAAVKELRHALELQPDFPEALYCMGVVHNRLGQFKDALDFLRKAVEFKPRYSEAYDQMAASYEGLGDIDRALAATKSAAELKKAYE